MASELTDDDVRFAIGYAQHSKDLGPPSLQSNADHAIALGTALLAARTRIATLSRDLADARAKLGQAERENVALHFLTDDYEIKREAIRGWESARALAIQYSAGATERAADEALAKLRAQPDASEKER